MDTGPDFCLHRQEKFYYASDWVNLWEWDPRVLDIQEGVPGDVPLCLGGRGAAPPEYCGGPTGYRLLLKRDGRALIVGFIPNYGERHRHGETISTAFVESTIHEVVSREIRQEATDAVVSSGEPILFYK